MSVDSGRAKEIFLDALEQPASAQRAFVEQACGGDVALHQRVFELLGAHLGADEALGATAEWTPEVPELPTPVFDQQAAAEAEVPRILGHFHLEERLGEGGFGQVWRAEQVRPVRRTVALKILRSGLESEQLVRRFEAERQALALMDHPCIARVFDGGTTETGRPWFALELVDGPPITAYCERNGLGLRARLELFLKVCHAVQHAHQKGVVHRDIKPSNVLVATLDDRPLPKVIDFGIAKALDARLLIDTIQTVAGQMVGTPAYMSPEQLDEATDVDTRADVYSLGVLLYELLSGSTPIDDTTVREAGLLGVFDMIRNVEPQRPSTRLGASTAGGRQTATRIRVREVQGDLDWIVLRCLEKDRDRRYGSVSELAAEIERHLAGEPVLAGPPTLAYRLTKLVRRHRALIGFGALVVVSLVVGLVAALGQARRARAAESHLQEEVARTRAAEKDLQAEVARTQAAERRLQEEVRRTRLELERFGAVAGFLEHVFLSIDPAVAQGKDTELLRDLLDVAEGNIAGKAGQSPEVEATLRRIIGGAYLSLALYDRAEEQLQRALDLRSEHLGDTHPDTLVSLEELGGLHLIAQRPAEADPYLRGAYEGMREAYGEEDERTAHALMNLATHLGQQERTDEALPLFEELERWYLEHRGPEHADTLLVMNNLAGQLLDAGRKDEALERLQKLAELQPVVAGPTHPRTLAALNNLGHFYLAEDRPDEAAAPLEQALAIKREVLPEGHPSLLTSLGNLSTLRKTQGAVEEARTLLDEALGMATIGLDPHATQVLQLHVMRGDVLLRLEAWEEAFEDALAVIELDEDLLANPHMLRTLATVLAADACQGQERYEDAEAFARDALDAAPRSLPATHGGHGAARRALGRALLAQGRLDEAHEALLAAWEALGPTGATREKRLTAEVLLELCGRTGDGEGVALWGARLEELAEL